MSTAPFIEGLKSMPDAERDRLFAGLTENRAWREDMLDLITIAQRRREPTRPIDSLFKDLKIDG